MKLKPCPFCGGKAETKSNETGYKIQCGNVSCCCNFVIAGGGLSDYECWSILSEKWNRRP